MAWAGGGGGPGKGVRPAIAPCGPPAPPGCTLGEIDAGGVRAGGAPGVGAPGVGPTVGDAAAAFFLRASSSRIVRLSDSTSACFERCISEISASSCARLWQVQREVGKGRGFAKRARVGSACIGRCEGAAARASARVPPALGRAAAAGRRHRAMKGDSEAMSLLASPSRSATSPLCQSRGRLLPPPHPRHRVCRAPCGCAASRRSRCRRHSAKPCHPRAAVTRGAPHGRCALSPVVPSLRPSLTPSVRARPRRGARATPVELRPCRGSPTPPLRGARRRDASEPARPQGQRARERKRRAAGPRRGTERASHHRTRAMGRAARTHPRRCAACTR